jgi:hypothetical protein
MTTLSSRRLTQRKQVHAISDLLNVSRRTVQRYIRKRNMLDENIQKNWVNICRLPRKDKISEDVKRQVIEYWTAHSRVSSNRRDTIQMKDEETGMKTAHPKHFIDTTQSELFESFKQEFSDVKICQRMFEKLRPCFVRINKVRETCCCQNHVEFHLYLQSYKKVMAVLNPDMVISGSTTQFVKSILCEKLEDSDEFKVQCIKSACSDCGDLHKFPFQIENINLATPVLWKRFEYETYRTKSGDESKKIVLKESELPYLEFMTRFRTIIYPDIQHCYGARWQAK